MKTEMEQSPLILVVEDEPKLATLLQDYLQASAFRVGILDNGNLVAAYVQTQKPALVLLDLMLPGKDGLSVCRELRASSQIPILMLTARIEEIDRLLGLELGADDYICKPFSPREVVARVKAVLRRSQNITDSARKSPLQLNEEKMQARIQGKRIELTPVEFRLLRALALRPGHVLSRAKLIDVLYNDHRIVSDRTVDSHIKNLRKKITEANQGNDPITSMYGLGYALDWEKEHSD
jgi:two-component system, OmpR family, response regulator BaeR